MPHEIRIKYDGDAAVITVDNVSMTISTDVASFIETSIRTFIREWLFPEDSNIFASPTGSMRVKIESKDNEVVFEVKEA